MYIAPRKPPHPEVLDEVEPRRTHIVDPALDRRLPWPTH
jgi:hypothetical protein